MNKSVLEPVRDAVRLQDAHGGIDHDLQLSAQAVSDPSDPNLSDVMHTVTVAGNGLDAVHQIGIDRIHEPAIHLAGGIPEHGKDGDGDEQANEGVGPRKANGDTAGAEEYSQ